MNAKRMIQVHPQPNCAASALLILRLVVGAAFILHGWGKIQHPFNWMGPKAPVPGVLQFLAALSEFGGGIAWILGFLTPLASFGIACTMAVAVYTVMVTMKSPFVNPTGGMSYELPLVFFAIALLFLTIGPGRFSLDALVFGERTKTS